jgi:hypothetical protein
VKVRTTNAVASSVRRMIEVRTYTPLRGVVRGRLRRPEDPRARAT